MTHQPSTGRTILVVEDDYYIADVLTCALEDENWNVLGPFPSVSRAVQALDEGKTADAAVLDVNLNGERVYPLVDRLISEEMPVVLTTGYDAGAIPDVYMDLPRLQKPVPMQQMIACLNKLLD
jgi:DNA-binding NtrC family response regulator